MHFFLLAAGNKARKALWPLLRFGYSYVIALCQSMANTDTGFGIKPACCLHVLPFFNPDALASSHSPETRILG